MRKDISCLGEFGIIDLFKQKDIKAHDWVMAGMGDDCAVLDLGLNICLVVTTDMLAEGSHFDLKWISTRQLGYRCLMVNLSDIAAMGAVPKAFFLSMGLPKFWDEQGLLGFRDGLFDCAARYDLNLLGGDTIAVQERAVFSLTLLGRSTKDCLVYRSGAQPGDRIMVAGSLGDSAGGLYLLQKQFYRLGDEDCANLTNAHLRPAAQLELGRMLAAQRFAKAMIDLSDGLVQDLGHICARSRVGAIVDADLVPVSKSLRALADCAGLDPLDFALHGGEDYVLCFCVPPELETRVIQTCRTQLQIEITKVGEIVAGSGVKVRQGGAWRKIAHEGFNHFGITKRYR